MKTRLLFAMIGCALMCGISQAGPPGNGAAAKEPTPAHPATPEPARLPLQNAPRPAPGAAAIGGLAKPTKAAPAITGMVNPAKNTAAVAGTGMKRKP